MNITSRLIAIGGTFAALSMANAQNILVNPGFETGDLTGWTTDGFGPNGAAHTGSFSAVARGDKYLEQDFAPIADTDISEVSFWTKQPFIGPDYFAAFVMLYSDSTFTEFITSGANSGGWAQFDTTSLLDPTKSLVGIQAYGYVTTPNPTEHDITY